MGQVQKNSFFMASQACAIPGVLGGGICTDVLPDSNRQCICHICAPLLCCFTESCSGSRENLAMPGISTYSHYS